MPTEADVKVIILTGPAGSGKSTVSDIIAQEDNWSQLKFAQALKSMLVFGLGLHRSQLAGPDKEIGLEILGGRTPRHAMQTLGTEWGRNLMHPSIWAIAEVRAVKELFATYPDARVIYDDCRFPNEIDLMREAFNTTVIRIVPEFEGYTPIEASGHSSEQQELDWDYTIVNKGDLYVLREQVKEVRSYL